MCGMTPPPAIVALMRVSRGGAARHLHAALLPTSLGHEGLVDVRDDTAACDRGLDEGVELLGGEVLQDRSEVHRAGATHAPARRGPLLDEAMHTAHGELQPGLLRARDLLLGGARHALGPLGPLRALARHCDSAVRCSCPAPPLVLSTGNCSP